MLNAPTAFLKSLCADSLEHLETSRYVSFLFVFIELKMAVWVMKETCICRRSSGTSSLILMKVFLVAGLFGLTGRNRSSVTISFSVASHAAYSIT